MYNVMYLCIIMTCMQHEFAIHKWAWLDGDRFASALIILQSVLATERKNIHIANTMIQTCLNIIAIAHRRDRLVYTTIRSQAADRYRSRGYYRRICHSQGFATILTASPFMTPSDLERSYNVADSSRLSNMDKRTCSKVKGHRMNTSS